MIPMELRMEPGERWIAHTTDNKPVIVELDSGGALVKWPLIAQPEDEYVTNVDERTVPEQLLLHTQDGWITLRESEGIVNTIANGKHVVDTTRYRCAVHSGSQHYDYSTIHGLESQIEGIEKWMKWFPVQLSCKPDESGKLDRISYTYVNSPEVVLDADRSLKLVTSFAYRMKPTNGEYSIRTSLYVRTETENPSAWNCHRETHQMMQDLISLAYGKPCALKATQVLRRDDQEDSADSNDWKDVYKPFFGRGKYLATTLESRDQPLFYREDTDPSRLESWMHDQQYWARPIWIASDSLFQKNVTAEMTLIQIAVALEALGYAIVKKRDIDKRPPQHFPSLLEAIFDYLDYEPPAVVGDFPNSEAWSKAFNTAYIGVKHADNPLPDPENAVDRAREGLTLIRCWLAKALGVPDEVVTKRFRSGIVKV